MKEKKIKRKFKKVTENFPHFVCRYKSKKNKKENVSDDESEASKNFHIDKKNIDFYEHFQ